MIFTTVAVILRGWRLGLFDWPGDEYHWDHVEIVIGVSSSEVTTLGGNTGDNNVKSRKWSLSNSNIRGYGVPKYTTGSTPSPDPTPLPLRAAEFRI